MKIKRELSKVFLVFLIVMLFVGFEENQSFGAKGGDWDFSSDRGDRGPRFSTRALHSTLSWNLDETRPYVEIKRDYYDKGKIIYFENNGEYLTINEIPKGTILTVPEGRRIKCVSFHTEPLRGGKGKDLRNGRVIYSGGTVVKYTYPSKLELFKK